MGTYATTTAIEIMMIGTSFDTATTSLVGKCIEWAENEIDKQLGGRYDVAAFKVTVPPMVKTMAEMLSMGYAYENLSRGGKESLTRGKNIVDRVMSNLKALAEQKLDLVDADGAIIDDILGGGQVYSTTDGYKNTFDERSPLNWAVDPTKLSDLDS
jgi:CTP-dependent riboflavin kinase